MSGYKVGFVAFDHPVLNHLVHAREVRDEVIPEIRSWPIEWHIVEDLPSLPREITNVAAAIRKADVDVVVFYIAGYCAEELPVILAAQLDCPIVLWSTNRHHLTPLSIISLVGTSRNLQHFGKKFLTVNGDAGSPETRDRILNACKTAALVKKLRSVTIGIMGNHNPGQVDTIVNEFQLRRLVPGLLYLDTLELLKHFAAVDESQAQALIEEKISGIKRVEVGGETLTQGLKWYLAMQAMIAKYKLDAITFRSWPELTEYQEFDRGLNASLLNEEGIVSIQEVDIAATITALILQYFADSPAFCGEIRSLSPEDDTFVLYHAGEAAFSLAATRDDIALLPSNNHAIDLQITLKPGRITLAKLTAFPDEKCKMLISVAAAVPEKDLVPGRAGVRIKTDQKVGVFFDKLTREGFEHHTLMAYGDLQRDLINVCDLLGIEKVVI